MKLASLRGGGRDGALIVVRSDNQVFAPAGAVAPTLQAALDDWAAVGDPGPCRVRPQTRRQPKEQVEGGRLAALQMWDITRPSTGSFAGSSWTTMCS